MPSHDFSSKEQQLRRREREGIKRKQDLMYLWIAWNALCKAGLLTICSTLISYHCVLGFEARPICSEFTDFFFQGVTHNLAMVSCFQMPFDLLCLCLTFSIHFNSITHPTYFFLFCLNFALLDFIIKLE